VDLAATPTGHGYWLITANGDVYTYGDARFFGTASLSAGAGDAVRLVPTADGAGYWVVTAQGSVYSFGDAHSFGSAAPDGAAGRVVDMAATPEDQGYWLLTAAGDVYGFGDARYLGSSLVKPGWDPAERIVSDAAGDGYWVVDQNGTAVAFGAAGAVPPTQGLLFAPVTTGDRAVLFAFSQLGKPYIWGGIGPKGYDCSGLAYRSWEVATVSWIPRESKDQYHGAGTPVAWDDLQAGDLIFWGSNQSKWQSVYHTAMYVGGSQIVESTADTVQLNTAFQWGATDLMGHGMSPAS
jgi:cell wall-associated NlpC family hydrolase